MVNNTKGVLWALLATGLFSIVAAISKVAVVEYHVLQILFFRQVAVFFTSMPSIAKDFPNQLRTRHPGLHALRLIGAFIALSCSIWAVAVLPLTTAITLGFAQVFFVALIAVFFLHEVVGAHRIGAVVMGFIGVVIVMRPGVAGIVDVHALIPILGAIGAAMAMTSVRTLSQTESTATLLAYQSIFIGVLAGIPLLWFWKTPDAEGALLLVVMSVLAAVANWVGVKALRLGEASVIGNIKYMQLVYAAILGFIVFDEIPDSYTIAGAAFIVCSALYLFHREALSTKNKATRTRT